MVGRSLGTVLAGAALAVGVIGCNAGHPTEAPSERTRAPAGPTAAEQIGRARRSGPGWLDYCPPRSGRAPAQYDLDSPGGGTIPGWCRTSLSRHALGDYITFAAHWDARQYHGKTGTVTFVYLVSRGATPGGTPVPLLVRQSGPLPP